MAKSTTEGSEKFQIAILTFFMTAGGFLLLTFVFQWFLNPSLETRAAQAKDTYQQLSKKLLSTKARNLRHVAKKDAANNSNANLREIVAEKRDAYGLTFSRFPSAEKAPSRRSGGRDEISQLIPITGAPLTAALQFIAAVKAAKNGIHVESVNISRERRAGPDADSWQVEVRFIDYQSAE